MVIKRASFFLVLALLVDFVAGNNPLPHRIRRISPEGGLYHNGIKSVTQDADGYIWFNTIDELYKFDAYRITRTQKISINGQLTVSPQFITTFCDDGGNFWVSTNIGLLARNPEDGSFSNAFYLGEDINFIEQDRYGKIWLLGATRTGYFDVGKNEFSPVAYNLPGYITFTSIFCNDEFTLIGTSNGTVLTYDYVQEKLILFCESQKKLPVLGIGSNDNSVFCLVDETGLLCFNKNGLYQKTFTFFLDDLQFLGNNIAKTLYIDKRGMVWIGTHRGLYVLNPYSENFQLYTSKAENEFSLPNNSIWCINEDRQGGLWIGTYSGGLAYANINDHPFQHIKDYNPISINNNFVSSFAEDNYGNYWIGTEGAGLGYYNRKNGQFVWHQHKHNVNSLSYDNVKALVRDNNGNLWIGMYNGGLDCFNPHTERFTNFKNIPGDESSLSLNHIYALQLEADSGLWIATQSQGIDFFQFKGKKFIRLMPRSINKNFLVYHFVNGMWRGSNDRLWIATRNGLKLLYIHNRTFKQYYFNTNDTISFGSNEIFCVYEDSSKTVWLGTKGFGLYSFDPENDTFTHYPFGEDLTASAVYSIQDDNAGNLWMGTNNGLYKFEKQSRTFYRYDRNDGIQGNLFYPNASLRCSTGELLFGGTNGFTIFFPDSIRKNPLIPEVVFTGLLINNQPASQVPAKKGQAVPIDQAAKVVFRHTQNVFTFEFTSLNYLMPEKNRFAYMLEGYDHDWLYTTANNRYATYSNLPSGKYRFKVKVSNNDGVWNNREKSIDVTILPPPWRSPWAYAVYLTLLAAALFATLRIVKVRREYLTQLHIERISKEKQSELNRLKIQFFTNISHEFKTPLTLIISPLKRVLRHFPEDNPERKNIELIHRNVIRLQNLINQLMTFRAIENKKLEVNCTPGDVMAFITELSDLFVPVAMEQKIHFIFDREPDSRLACFDHDKYEKIFYNLLSNAVKFTPPEGHIFVLAQVARKPFGENMPGGLMPKQEWFEVKVTNTGSPIPRTQMQNIFENYYQTGRFGKLIQRGSGLGLAFTKELVDLLEGHIEVTSNETETCFTVSLPITDHDPEQHSETRQHAGSLSYGFDYSNELVNLLYVRKLYVPPSDNNKGKPVLLLVEDNWDLQNFLHELFSSDYRVFTASDGIEGLALAREKNPALIVSDVLMPNMSGTQLCNHIKSDLTTSHIPIVLLSALGAQENKTEGLESGADVYIEKPFDPEYLLLQVKNLMKLREAARRAFSHKIEIEPEAIAITPADELFIKKAVKTVENQIGNPDFNVDYLVREMAMSRTLLYQKIKALTDLSVNEFIINIRLKRAANLLRGSNLTISEIAWEVGFNEPKYFSTCFKKYFNLSPKSYVQQARQEVPPSA